MRLYIKALVGLVVFLGLLFQATARALPFDRDGEDNLSTLSRRWKLPTPNHPVHPPTVPGTAPKPPGSGADGLKPPPVIKPKPEPQNHPGSEPKPNPNPNSKNPPCKRADCTSDIGLHLTSTGLSAPPGYGWSHMNLWGSRETRTGWVDWIPTANSMRNQALQDQFNRNLANFARRIYMELKADTRSLAGKDGDNIVAALYVPDKGVIVSTIPRGNTQNIIKQHWKDKAPGLYRATGNERGVWPNAFHAEDGVIYWYETRHPLRDHNEKFPEGSRIAVYGFLRGKNGGEYEVKYPCSGERTGRDPGCRQVLENLGISIL